MTIKVPSLFLSKGILYAMESSTAADGSRLESDANSTSERAIAFAEFAVNESRDVLSFYEVEAQILALYDHLNDLKLEIALSEARDRLPSSKGRQKSGVETIADRSSFSLVDDLSQHGDPTIELKAAEKEYLEARAAYLLRNGIVESVITTDPILKAVHAGVNATPAERWVCPPHVFPVHLLMDRKGPCIL